MARLPRMVIYVKDIQCIKGCSERSARYLMEAMRKSLGREKHQYISIKEFCGYTGLKIEEVREYVC